MQFTRTSEGCCKHIEKKLDRVMFITTAIRYMEDFNAMLPEDPDATYLIAQKCKTAYGIAMKDKSKLHDEMLLSGDNVIMVCAISYMHIQNIKKSMKNRISAS